MYVFQKEFNIVKEKHPDWNDLIILNYVVTHKKFWVSIIKRWFNRLLKKPEYEKWEVQWNLDFVLDCIEFQKLPESIEKAQWFHYPDILIWANLPRPENIKQKRYKCPPKSRRA